MVRVLVASDSTIHVTLSVAELKAMTALRDPDAENPIFCTVVAGQWSARYHKSQLLNRNDDEKVAVVVKITYCAKPPAGRKKNPIDALLDAFSAEKAYKAAMPKDKDELKQFKQKYKNSSIWYEAHLYPKIPDGDHKVAVQVCKMKPLENLVDALDDSAVDYEAQKRSVIRTWIAENCDNNPNNIRSALMVATLVLRYDEVIKAIHQDFLRSQRPKEAGFRGIRHFYDKLVNGKVSRAYLLEIGYITGNEYQTDKSARTSGEPLTSDDAPPRTTAEEPAATITPTESTRPATEPTESTPPAATLRRADAAEPDGESLGSPDTNAPAYECPRAVDVNSLPINPQRRGNWTWKVLHTIGRRNHNSLARLPLYPCHVRTPGRATPSSYLGTLTPTLTLVTSRRCSEITAGSVEAQKEPTICWRSVPVSFFVFCPGLVVYNI